MNFVFPNIRPLWFVLPVLIVLSGMCGPVWADDADSDFMYATGLFRKQRWEYAADAFDSFLKEHPQHRRAALARLYLGLSLNSLEKYGPAREQFETFIKENPDSRNMADARYRLGECTFYLRDYTTAIAQLQDYLKNHQGHNLNDWAALMVGESYNAMEDWDSAVAVLQPLLESGPDGKILADTLFGLGVSFQGQQQWDKAMELFRKVADLKSDGFSARALARIGTIYFGNEDFNRASEVYDELADSYSDRPISASALLQSGIAQFQLGQFAKALLRLEKVSSESDVYPYSGMWRGLCHRELGQLDAARLDLGQALTAAGDSPLAAEILFNRAQVELLDGKKDLACQMFLDLADRWPQDRRVPDGLFNSAELRMELGELEESRRLLERLKADYPPESGQPRVALLEGRLLLNENRLPEAVKLLREVTELPDGTERDKLLRRYHLIRALHQGREFGEALAAFEPLREAFADPMSAEFLGAVALAAMSSLELKEYAAAKDYAEEFLKLESDPARAADALSVHAVASSHLKQFDLVKADLARLIRDFPDNAQTWTAALQSAEAAWRQQEFAASAELFQLVMQRKTDPKLHLSALSGTAWSFYRLGRFDDAAILFRQARSDYPNSPNAVESGYMEAMCTFEAGKPGDSAALFLAVYDVLDQRISADGGAADEQLMQYLLDAGRMHARIVGKTGPADEADKMWERLASRFEKDPKLDEILDEWAYLNLQNERFERSDQIYKRLLDDFPDSRFAGHARLSLAESAVQANRLDAALREFTAIAMNPRYGAAEKEAALYHAIDIHAAQRDWPEVIQLATQFADSYSSSDLAPNVQLLHAEGLLDQSQLPAAKAKLVLLRQGVVEGQLANEPWTDRIWVALAEVALAEKKYTEIDSLAAELQQRRATSRFLFQMRDVQGRRWKSQAEPDFAKARDYFSQVIRDEIGRGTETAARCQFLIAETMLMEGDFESALKEYYRLYLNYPYDDWRARGLFQAAGCEKKLMRFDAATKSYQDLIADFPDSELVAQAENNLRDLAAGKD